MAGHYHSLTTCTIDISLVGVPIMLLVLLPVGNVVSEALVSAICSFKAVNDSQVAEVCVCEFLDDIPYKLPVEVNIPSFTPPSQRILAMKLA